MRKSCAVHAVETHKRLPGRRKNRTRAVVFPLFAHKVESPQHPECTRTMTTPHCELGGACFLASAHFETGHKGKVGPTPQELFLSLICPSRQSEEKSGQRARRPESGAVQKGNKISLPAPLKHFISCLLNQCTKV